MSKRERRGIEIVGCSEHDGRAMGMWRVLYVIWSGNVDKSCVRLHFFTGTVGVVSLIERLAMGWCRSSGSSSEMSSLAKPKANDIL